MRGQPAIEATDISCSLRDGGLEGVSFQVGRGERVAIFGPAASGKTLLLSILSGRRMASAGELSLLGTSPQEASHRIGCALQSDPNQRSGTPRQRISSALAEAHVPPSQRPARLTEALEIAGLYSRADRSVRELNQSAVASLKIAVAVAHRPEMILLDDLFACMSTPHAIRWWDYLETRRHLDRVTVVHATTKSGEAELADRVLLILNGRKVAFSEPKALLADSTGEEICVEAADVAAVERTLRGVSDVTVVMSPDGVKFYAADAAGVAAHLFRHPVGGMRSVFVRRPTLWDCFPEADSVFEGSQRSSE